MIARLRISELLIRDLLVIPSDIKIQSVGYEPNKGNLVLYIEHPQIPGAIAGGIETAIMTVRQNLSSIRTQVRVGEKLISERLELR